MASHGNLVAGEWVSGADTNRNLNPSNLDDDVGEYVRADAAQAKRAIAAGRVPYGGRKASSYGPCAQGRHAAEFYTTVKILA